jgi:hypothetical protein
MRSLLELTLAAFAAVTLLGCSDATGTVHGGDALVVDPCTASLAENGGGHRWQDLYTCYFGPTGKASCAAQGICHGSASQLGAQFSTFVCGPSKDACWQGMTAPGSIVPMGGTMDGTQTILYGSLRKPDNTGLMPCSPVETPLPDGGTNTTCGSAANGNYTFTTDDLARITAWIQEGAQDN